MTTDDPAHKDPTPLLHHYRWDVDKTYIHTDFDSFGDLVSAWRQKPEEKRNIPGAPALLKELLGGDRSYRRITFISGSPRQMKRVLLQKFELDGIQPDAFILKPNLSNLLTLRLKAVRSQVGYKLSALLDSRIAGAEEYLFGDDSEQDAFIYSLYADLLAHRVGVDQLQELLSACDLYQREVEELVRKYLALPARDGFVRRVFIHLDRRSPISRFSPYGARVVPVYNYFQAAAVLFHTGSLTAEALQRILAAMEEEGYTPRRLANSLQDLVRRGYLPLTAITAIQEALRVASAETALSHAIQQAMRELRRPDSRTRLTDTMPDYLGIIEHQRYRRAIEPVTGQPWLQDPP